jgi:two-component system CheB/CheR fusion protein
MSDMSLVSCRNVPIYLPPEQRREALSTCRQALAPGGYLFLGPSQTPSSAIERLSVIDRRWRIYQKIMPRPKDSAMKHLPKVYRDRPT